MYRFVHILESGYYGDVKAPSIAIPDAPRGFFIALKTDSAEENRARGNSKPSMPAEAKTPLYMGDYLKIDWVYPHPDIQGLHIPRNYFYAVECAARKIGYPSLHIDATNNGLSYWAREEFGLKIPKEQHLFLLKAYRRFKANPIRFIQKARAASSYVGKYDRKPFPKKD